MNQGLFLVRVVSAQEMPKLDVTIYLESLGWTRQQNGTYMVDAQVRVYVQYAGTDPPESVGLTPSLDLTDPLYIASKLLIFSGPWVEVSSNLWTLRPMLNGSVSFQDYSFQTTNLQPWPNDALESKVFMAFATTTRSGKSVAGMQTTLNARVISRDVFEKSYYYMLDASSMSGPDLILSQEGKSSVMGHLYTLFLSHGAELKGFAWIGYLASYYVYTLILIATAIFVLAYKDRLKSFGTTVAGYLAILAAASFQVSPYLSPWSSYVRQALSNSILLLVVLGPASYAAAFVIRRRAKNAKTQPLEHARETIDSAIEDQAHDKTSQTAQRPRIESYIRGRKIFLRCLEQFIDDFGAMHRGQISSHSFDKHGNELQAVIRTFERYYGGLFDTGFMTQVKTLSEKLSESPSGYALTVLSTDVLALAKSVKAYLETMGESETET